MSIVSSTVVQKSLLDAYHKLYSTEPDRYDPLRGWPTQIFEDKKIEVRAFALTPTRPDRRLLLCL